MDLLSCTNLRFGHAGQTPFTCPDFTVRAGDTLRIAGPNGTGKTTLLRVLAGLLPPFGGEVVRAPELARGGIGYLPQRSPLQDDFPATVREIVLSGCQALRGWRPYYSRHERDLACAALHAFDATDLVARPYRDLSGGQRQRVLLARAIAAPRRLLMLDEPTTGLDDRAVGDLRDVLARLQARGVALVVVTHDESLLGGASVPSVRIGREGGARHG